MPDDITPETVNQLRDAYGVDESGPEWELIDGLPITAAHRSRQMSEGRLFTYEWREDGIVVVAVSGDRSQTAKILAARPGAWGRGFVIGIMFGALVGVMATLAVVTPAQEQTDDTR